jgi:VanZ family protein
MTHSRFSQGHAPQKSDRNLQSPRSHRGRIGPAQVSADRPFNLRAWCAVLAGLTAAFAAYISLVPFNFTRSPDATLGAAFHLLLEVGLVSRTNFAGNVLLFIPLGFFGSGVVFSPAQHRAYRVIGAVAFVALSIALSVAIELLQIFVPGRTPSIADVTAQTMGMLAGMGAWLLVSREILAWAERRGSDRSYDALRIGLLVFTVARALGMLLPLDVTLDLGLLAEKYRSGFIVLNPLRSTALSWAALPARLADLALSVPIGVFACLGGISPGRRRHAGLALLLGWAFVGFVEAAQVFVMSRTADVVEWFVNATGVAAGVWLTMRLVPARVGEKPAPFSWVPIGGLVASLVLYVLYNWSPFDFQVSADLIRPRIPMIFGVPFYGYYQNPEIKAIDDLLVKIAIGVPIGIFLSWWIRGIPAIYRRVVAAIASLLIVTFIVVVEAGQILLPTRYPESTDILLGLGGVLVGSWVIRTFRPSRAS